MKENGLKNRKVLVMGLGLHGGGLAMSRWLLKHQAKVTVTDLKQRSALLLSINQLNSAQKKQIKWVLGKHHSRDFTSSDIVIQNPDVPRESPYLREARKSGAIIENDASLFLKYCPAPIIGVTGTRGKSTTATLISQLLQSKNKKVWLAGLPQQPMMAILDNIKSVDQVVLELSSWQLEVLGAQKRSPHVAVLTNFYPDHLNRYSNLKAYRQAKEHIVRYQRPSDIAIINFDNPTTRAIGRGVKAKRFWFSTKRLPEVNGCFVSAGAIVFRLNDQEKKIISLASIKLAGEHNLENILAAVTVAAIHNINPKQIAAVLKQFTGLSNRIEFIRRLNGVRYVNDTTATTPRATLAALKTINTPVVLIAGGASKKIPNAEYRLLAQTIKKSCRAVILLAGPGSVEISNQLTVLRAKLPLVTNVTTMVEAVALARTFGRVGDTVLLSPASASFGLFSNEFERGKQFTTIVNRL